jgi:hypothetical protein
VFWRDHFPKTPFWKVARGQLVPAAKIIVLPLSLVKAFYRPDDPWQGWEKLLRFLLPITLPGGLSVTIS